MGSKVTRFLLAAVALCASIAHAGLYENGIGPSPGELSFSSGTNNASASSTEYWPMRGGSVAGNTTEDVVYNTFAVPGVLRNLACYESVTLTSTMSRAVSVNATGGAALTCTINSASTCAAFPSINVTGRCCQDTTHSTPVSPGQISDFKTVPTNSPTASPITCTAEFDPLGGSNPVPVPMTSSSANAVDATSVRYMMIQGGEQTLETSNSGALIQPVPGVYRNLVCLKVSGAQTGTKTLTFLLEGSSGASSLTCQHAVGSTCPGFPAVNVTSQCCQDTTHAVATGAGDEWWYKITPANTAITGQVFCSMEFDPAGGVSPTIPVVTKSADYTVTAADFGQSQVLMLLCSTGSARTITLPAANTVAGKTLRLKREGANKCTASRAGSDTLYDGASVNTRDLTADGEVIELTSDGVSSWPLH